jgi:hypothetical protein
MARALESVLSLLSSTAIADLSSTTQTTLYTVPTGKKLILHSAFLEVAADVGALLVVTIGQNGAVTDWVGTTNGDNLDADEDCILMAPVPSATPAKQKIYSAGTVIELDVATGGNGIAGVLHLFGFLISV